MQHFGSFQQPTQGFKDVHLPAPDSISTSFEELRSDEGEWSEIDERKSERRRKWLRAYAVAVAIITVLFILFTQWLDNYIEQNGPAYKNPQLQQELREILEQRDSH